MTKQNQQKIAQMFGYLTKSQIELLYLTCPWIAFNPGLLDNHQEIVAVLKDMLTEFSQYTNNEKAQICAEALHNAKSIVDRYELEKALDV